MPDDPGRRASLIVAAYGGALAVGAERLNLLGREGRALSPLHPAGIADIDGGAADVGHDHLRLSPQEWSASLPPPQC